MNHFIISCAIFFIAGILACLGDSLPDSIHSYSPRVSPENQEQILSLPAGERCEYDYNCEEDLVCIEVNNIKSCQSIITESCRANMTLSSRSMDRCIMENIKEVEAIQNKVITCNKDGRYEPAGSPCIEDRNCAPGFGCIIDKNNKICQEIVTESCRANMTLSSRSMDRCNLENDIKNDDDESRQIDCNKGGVNKPAGSPCIEDRNCGPGLGCVSDGNNLVCQEIVTESCRANMTLSSRSMARCIMETVKEVEAIQNKTVTCNKGGVNEPAGSPCIEDRNCAPGFGCISGKNNKICQEIVTESCRANFTRVKYSLTQAQKVEIEKMSILGRPCNDNKDCNQASYFCSKKTGKCQQRGTKRCEEDAECFGGLCRDGVCTECDGGKKDCGLGKFCREGKYCASISFKNKYGWPCKGNNDCSEGLACNNKVLGKWYCGDEEKKVEPECWAGGWCITGNQCCNGCKRKAEGFGIFGDCY